MKYSNSIEYNISTKFDSSGLTKLKSELAQLELTLQNMGNKNQLFNFDEYRTQIQGLGDALTEAFDPSLGVINLKQFGAALKENNVTAEGLRSAFRAAGADGQVAFNSLIGQIGQLDTGIKRTSSAVDKMFTTFSNTFRWGLVSSFWSQFLNAIHSSVEYTKELDDSLTQIMLVTDYSRDSMNEYAKAANEAAKAVGQTTVGMTNASLIFAQQGYDLNQSQQLATLSAKLANASQQDTAATSDQITAYMNAYGLQDNMEELAQAMDNWALIANISAADVEEIALASQRAASMANAVGVSGEALAAQIATIESVTREAPEQIGNGLKTLYARFSDLQLGKEDEDGITLGKVTGTLESIGVQVLDSLGNVRSMDDIMEDLMAIWQDLDDTTQEAVAQTLAGKHQVNRFTALMDNADMYQEYLGATGANAAGTLEQMNQEYMDSLQGRLATLQATIEGLFNDVFTTDMVYPLVDVLTKLAEAIDTLFKSVGGGPTVILGLASAFTKLFSNSIASSINDSALNISVQRQRAANFEDRQGMLAWLGSVNPNPDSVHSQAILNYAQGINNMAGSFNIEQMNKLNEILREMVTNANAAEQANNELKASLEGLNVVSNALFGAGTESFIDDFGAVNAVSLIDSLNSLTGDKSSNLTFLFDSLRTLESDFTGFSSGLTDILNKLKQGLNGSEVGSFTEEFTNLETVLARLEKVLPTDQFNKFKYVLQEAKDITENWASQELPPTQEQLKEIQLQLNNTTDGLKKFIAENKKLTPQAIVDYLQKTEKAAIAAKTAMSAANGSDKVGLAALQTAINQQRIKSYIDLASAIGQVAFSIQSLKNLYTIWNSDDLSMADKLLQTFTNLGIVIPNIISALKSATGIKSIGELGSVFSLNSIKDINKINSLMLEHEKLLQNVKEAQSNLAKSSINLEKAKRSLYTAAAKENRDDEELIALSQKVDAAKQQETLATDNLKKAEDAAAASSQRLAAAQAMLNIAILAIVATVAIVASAISAHAESLQREIRKSGEAFNEAFEKTQIDTSRFDELYEEYKKTGVASDELKEAGESLGEQLDILGTHAYVASENFNGLAEEIRNAKDASIEFTEESANDYLTESNVAAEDFTTRIGYVWNKTWTSVIGQVIPNLLSGVGPLSRIGAPDDPLSQFNINSDEWESLSALEKNNLLSEYIQGLNEVMKQAEEAGDSTRANFARRRKQYYEDMQEDLFGELSTITENMVELTLDTLSEQDFEGQGAEELLKMLFDPNGDYSWLAAQAEQIGAEYGDEAAEEFKNSVVSGLSSQAAEDILWRDAQQASREQLNNNPLLKTKNGLQRRGEESYEDLLQTLEDSGFSSEQKASIVDAIDWNDPALDQNVAEVASQIEAGLSAEQIVLKLTFEWDNIDQQLDYTEEEAKKILKDAGLEGVSVDEYAQSFLEMGGAGAEAADEVETLTEEIRWLNNEMAGVKEGSAEWEGLNYQLENAQDKLRNIALASLQTRNGMQQLSSSWKSIQENINSTNIADQVVGYQNLQPILSNILNVDSSAITQEFMQNTDVQSNIQRIAEGDMAALDDLRNNYSQIVVTAMLEDLGLTEGIYDLTGLVRDATNNIDDIEVGATLDISQYQSALQDLLISQRITADQLQNMFSGIGYDVQVDYDVVWLPNAQTVSSVMNSAASVIGEYKGIENNVGKITKSDLKIQSKTLPATPVRVPKITFTKKGSPSSGGTGKTGGSGGSSCFVAGTLISTVDSFKEIENIQVGDIVLSYNEEIHQNEYSVVLQTMIHDVTEEIYNLYIEDETLSVTGIHRFYIRRKHDIEWIPASDLHIGDYVLFADGTWHVISNIEIKVQTLLVYNFEVSYNHNYYVGRNQILAHNKGGSGGGSGGGNSNTMERKDPIDHEKDYYEEVDSQLDKIGETLSGIEKEEDRLIGEKARQNQAKQIALLKQEIDLQDKKLGKLKEEQDDVKGNIGTSTTTIIDNINKALGTATDAEKKAVNTLQSILNNTKFKIPAIKIDEQGVISNFEDISKQLDATENELINKYNTLIKQYNESNSDSTKEQIEALDKIISKFEEEANGIRENIQRYNDLQTEAVQLKNTMADLQDQIEDLRIEAYKGSLDALDNLKEINETAASFAGIMTGLKTDDPLREMTERLSRINHTFKMTKEEAEGFLKSMQSDMVTEASRDYFKNLIEGLSESDLANGRIGFLAKELERLRNWGLGGKDNPFGDNQQAWLETYNEVYKKLEEAASEYQEEEEGIVDTIIDYYDEIDEKQQDYMDQFEQLADKMEWLKDVYSIRYGDESYQALSDIGTKQAEVLQSSLSQQVHIYDLWAKRYEEALNSHDEELARDARQRMDEAEKNMQDLAKESAETFVDAYNDAIDAAIQKMYNKVLGDTENNLDHLDRNWEWDKKNIDGYRDEVERTFEVEQLRSKYNDLLNSAQGSSLATQNKIRQQMAEQIKLLEEQKTVSEYDVKLANSKLTILQKQIALEDAQRNKNQMQLRRDTQGNYRYVYRASQNDIAKARQEYIQAVQDAYELTKDQRQKTAEELAKALKDYAKDYEDISKNMNLPAEQRAKELQELTDKFREYMQNLQEDLGDTGAGLSDVLGFMIKNGTDDVAEAAQKMLSKLGKLGTGEGTGIPWLDALAGYSKIADANVEDVTTKLLGQTAKDAEELSQQLDKVFSTIPTKITEYTETINDTQNKTDALTDSTKAYLDTLERLPGEMQKGLAEIIKYNTELPELLKLLENVKTTYNDLIRLTTAELPFQLNTKDANIPNNKNVMYNDNKFDLGSNRGRLLSQFIGGYSGERGTVYGSGEYLVYLDDSGIWRRFWIGDPIDWDPTKVPASIWRKLATGELKNWDPTQMATGGYTGNWGKDGKLAVLHEKELVLNAQDTSNILAAVKAAKQFVSSLGTGSLGNYIGSKPIFNAGTDSIEQRVEIKAEFPNVRDSFEIERALINLSDNAYQYAHRNI